MKLACNYYPETEELVSKGTIDIDYFKFPALGFQTGILEKDRKEDFEAFTARITKLKPILLHGLYPAPHDLSSTTLTEDFDFETMNRFIEQTKTPGLSFHPTLTVIDPSADSKALVRTIIRNLQFIKKHYADMEFISLENGDSFRFGPLIDPQVITEIIRESGCQFLLDISHAYCASRCRNENVRDYLSKLPLDHVYEIHINGWLEKADDVMCHVKIQEEGYAVLKEVLAASHPEIVTLEYGRNNDRISAGIPLVCLDRKNPMVKKEIVEQISRLKCMIE